jgi:hypothetical protein
VKGSTGTKWEDEVLIKDLKSHFKGMGKNSAESRHRFASGNLKNEVAGWFAKIYWLLPALLKKS